MGLYCTLVEFDCEFVIIWMKKNDKHWLKQPTALPPSSHFVFKLLQSFITCMLQMWLHKYCKEPPGEIWGFELSKARDMHKLSCTAVLKEKFLIYNLLLLIVSDDVLSRVLLRYACFICWPWTDNKPPSLKHSTYHPHINTHTWFHLCTQHDTRAPKHPHEIHACIILSKKHMHIYIRTCSRTHTHTHFLSLSRTCARVHTHTHHLLTCREGGVSAIRLVIFVLPTKTG